MISALAEKLQAVVPITSGQMVRPVTLVNLSGQSGTAASGLQGGATPQQLAAAAQAGQQAAHQFMSALAAQNSAVSAASGVYSQVRLNKKIMHVFHCCMEWKTKHGDMQRFHFFAVSNMNNYLENIQK